MYALKIEEYFSSNYHENCVDGIHESSNDSYQSSLDNIEESNDQLSDQITTLAGQINAANYRFLKLIAEFDRRQAWAGYGIRSCAHWLSWKCGLDMNTAREKVRVARALEELPAINAAFEKGELSFSKVRAMTRAATDINESYLLMIAEYGTTQQMETLAKYFRTVSRIEKFDVTANNDADLGTSEEKKELNQQQFEQEARSVSCYQDDEGMWIIKAKLPAEEGALVAKALQALGDNITDAKKRKVGNESSENDEKNVSAETEMEKLSFGVLVEKEEEKEEKKLTFPQRRADALVAITEHYLASGSDGSQDLSSLKGAERCQLVMQEDEVGNVLDIGRKTRIIPVAMARALAIRDSGCCQFPGCCESRYTEGHHIKHWADGGDTKLDNLVTLCRYHHRELHKGSFFLSLKLEAPSKRFVERLCFSKVDCYFDAPFHRSNDFVIAANPAKFTCACCDFSELEKALPGDIDDKTAVTKWTGESMDVGMAVDGLLRAGKKVTCLHNGKH